MTLMISSDINFVTFIMSNDINFVTFMMFSDFCLIDSTVELVSQGCNSMLSAVVRVPEAMLIALQDTQQSQQIPFIIINYFVYRSL